MCTFVPVKQVNEYLSPPVTRSSLARSFSLPGPQVSVFGRLYQSASTFGCTSKASEHLPLYLTVPATSEFASPERIFSRVGLVKTDFSVWEHSGHHHDWPGSDSDVGKTSTLNHTFHLLTHPYVYKASLYLTHKYIRITVTLTSPHTLTYLTNYQPC